MTPDQIHDQITAQRADELARLRYENSILKRLLVLCEQGCWPVCSHQPIKRRKRK